MKKLREKLALINFLNQVFLAMFDILREILKGKSGGRCFQTFCDYFISTRIIPSSNFLTLSSNKYDLIYFSFKCSDMEVIYKILQCICISHISRFDCTIRWLFLPDLASLKSHCANSELLENSRNKTLQSSGAK